MKYILMMNAPRGTGEYQNAGWSPADFKAHMAHMYRLNTELTESGEMVGVEALAPPGETKVVRVGENGEPVVTDGPFPESKEFLAGYWIVDVDRVERAYEIAAQASAAPGPGGTPLVIPIELRRVMSIDPA
ncbi:MAG: YciI family protein [bacterium]